MLHTQRGRVILHPYNAREYLYILNMVDASVTLVVHFRVQLHLLERRVVPGLHPMGAFFRKIWAPLSTAPVRLGDASVTLLRTGVICPLPRAELSSYTFSSQRFSVRPSPRPAYPNRHTPSRWGTSKVASFQQRRVISRPPR